MFDLCAADRSAKVFTLEGPSKAFRHPFIRAYIDLAINKRPATAACVFRKKQALGPDPVGHRLCFAIKFTPMART